jgi:hypothetical protein
MLQNCQLYPILMKGELYYSILIKLLNTILFE